MMLVFAIPNTNYVQAKEKTSKVQITKKQRKFDKAFRQQFNNYRKSLNVNKLRTDNCLIRAARVRAEELTIDFSHTRPKNKALIKLCDHKSVKKARYYGEIIARVEYNKDNSFDDIAKATLKAWKKSPSHNACILDNKYNRVGTSFYISDGSIFICSIFCG